MAQSGRDEREGEADSYSACIGGPRITAGYMYRANDGQAYNV